MTEAWEPLSCETTEDVTEVALLATMEALRLDALAVEVAGALEHAGCGAVLLKGASTARWLYDDGAPRPYGDVDLLVDRREADRVDRVLLGLGFASLTAGSGLPEMDYADIWMRRGNEYVDLHVSLPSAGDAVPEDVWDVLAAHVESWPLAGGRIRVLDWAARSVVVVLHAIHHGPHGSVPIMDLQRLLARLGPADWPAVAALAGRLGVTEEFSAGLRLLPAGAAVAASVDLPEVATTALRLKSSGALYDGARGIDRIVRAGSVRAGGRLVLAELFPAPAGLRRLSALAHRGRVGLAGAYLLRPFLIAYRLPGGMRSWMRARRSARRASARSGLNYN